MVILVLDGLFLCYSASHQRKYIETKYPNKPIKYFKRRLVTYDKLKLVLAFATTNHKQLTTKLMPMPTHGLSFLKCTFIVHGQYSNGNYL